MIGTLIRSLTSPSLLRLVAASGVLGWVVGFTFYLATLDGRVAAEGKAIGGDFICFYSAGHMLLADEGSHIYDFCAQQETQRHILRRPESTALGAYVNPPTLAVPFALLAILPYRIAFVVYTMLACAALIWGLKILRPHLPALQPAWGTVLGLSLLFFPYIVSITGGQNTAISFLLTAAAYVALQRGSQVTAGLVLGLLLYKPQMAMVLCVLLCWRGQLRCVATAAAVAVGHYLLGALLCGARWPLNLLAMLQGFQPLNKLQNGDQAISLMAASEYALPHAAATLVAGTLIAGTVALLWNTWRATHVRDARFALTWGIGLCATLLLSPHALWYDVGLVLPAILLGLNFCLRQGHTIGLLPRGLLLLAFLVAPAYALAESLGWQPLVLYPLITMLWLARLAGREPAGSFDTGEPGVSGCRRIPKSPPAVTRARSTA